MKNGKMLTFANGIIFFIVGLIIFFYPETVVKFISYSIGGVLIAMGIYKTVNYIIQDKRLGVVNNNEIAFGITAIVLGILFIFLAGTIELLLRFIVGGWLILAGLSRIVTTFYTTDRDARFYALIIIGLILISVGLYIVFVSNLALSLIGLCMAIYGIIDFVSYFVYKNNPISFIKVTKDKKDTKVLEGTVEEKEDE